jgi:hypothetical protein
MKGSAVNRECFAALCFGIKTKPPEWLIAGELIVDSGETRKWLMVVKVED